MLNNRLEDLIHLYKRYRFRKIMKNCLYAFILVIVFVGIGAIYNKISSIKSYENRDKNISINKKKDVNQTTQKISKKNELPKPKIINIVKKKTPIINEDEAMDRNSFKTLMAIERNKPTYNSAYDLAKYFFDKKDYKMSAKWAMVATNRDDSQDKAWILYAKSKIKLKQKGIAKKALKIYLLKYHSQEISNLLNSL